MDQLETVPKCGRVFLSLSTQFGNAGPEEEVLVASFYPHKISILNLMMEKSRTTLIFFIPRGGDLGTSGSDSPGSLTSRGGAELSGLLPINGNRGGQHWQGRPDKPLEHMNWAEEL